MTAKFVHLIGKVKVVVEVFGGWPTKGESKIRKLALSFLHSFITLSPQAGWGALVSEVLSFFLYLEAREWCGLQWEHEKRRALFSNKEKGTGRNLSQRNTLSRSNACSTKIDELTIPRRSAHETKCPQTCSKLEQVRVIVSRWETTTGKNWAACGAVGLVDVVTWFIVTYSVQFPQFRLLLFRN